MYGKTIGEFAKSCGVGVETIRFYQRKGLLAVPEIGKELNAGKTRRYTIHDIQRLNFIISAKTAGFTLKEIKELLDLDANNDRERVRDIAQRRIEILNIKIAGLTAARDSLGRLVTECKESLLEPCPILKAFE